MGSPNVSPRTWGLAEFRDDPIGDKWNKQPPIFKSRRFIAALQLRSNTTSVNVNISRSGYQVIYGPSRDCTEMCIYSTYILYR
jgi:hypothetical protein